jgi:hypothetical protein
MPTHAKRFRRHYRQLSFLRGGLGRIIGDINRKIASRAEFEVAMSARARNQIRAQRPRQRGWKLIISR